MKKFLALLLAMTMAGSLVACAPKAPAEPSPEVSPSEEVATPVDITMWTYPIGNWKDEATVNGIIAKFNEKHPEIKVSVQYLDYKSGDDQVMSALNGGTAPDIIMEGPERLVTNWGKAGKMVDLTDLWTAEVTADITATSQAVVDACKAADGAFYEYPLCMTTHCMAINKEVFEKADALQYIDMENRTWTTDGFLKAIAAVKAAGEVQTPGIVYCGGQGGDQGTRALVNNLYSGKYTTPDHTGYTANSAENVKALTTLAEQVKAGNLSANASFAAADELQAFANGTAAMSFCWNASNEAQYAEQVAFTPYALAFPSDDGKPELCGGIWGFGVFNNGDDAKIAAAKTFIQYVSDDPDQAANSVSITGFFPTRASLGNVYAGTEDEARMAGFTAMMPYLGDYYNVTGGWTEQRTAWWNMLQQVFGGTDVQKAADEFVATANAAIK
ncbi:MAG: extracellular solute-binding protein [Oscillospiraceae bacterium]